MLSAARGDPVELLFGVREVGQPCKDSFFQVRKSDHVTDPKIHTLFNGQTEKLAD